MDEEVTTFRVRFTLPSGTFFRKRFLASARLQPARYGILPSRILWFRHEIRLGGDNGKFVPAECRNQVTAATAPQKALALWVKHD